MRNRDLGALTAALTVVTATDALLLPGMAAWSALLRVSYFRIIMPYIDMLGVAVLILKLVSGILFCRWLYVAGDNLLLAGFHNLRFTPAKRVLSFFVPIASFFMPFLGMRELWNASHGEPNLARNHPLVSAWWALWMLGGLLTASLFLVTGLLAFAAFALLMVEWLIQGVIVILMIHAVTRAQISLNREDDGDVFA